MRHPSGGTVRGSRPVLVITLVVLAAVATAVVVSLLASIRVHDRTALLAADVEKQIAVISRDSLTAADTGQFSDADRRWITLAGGQLARDVRELQSLGVKRDGLGPLVDATATFTVLMRRERALLDGNHFVEARLLGSAEVQPAVAEIELRTAGATQRMQDAARRSTQQAQLIVVLLIPLTMAAIGLMLARDNRRQRLAARALAETSSRSRFETLVEASRDLLVLTDADGVILYASPSLPLLLGYTAADWHGRDLLTVVDVADMRALGTVLASVTAEPNGSRAVDVTIVGSDGSRRAFECFARNLIDEPNVGGIAWTMRDITQRRALERQLAHQALHDTLTGLANRALFGDRLEQALGQSQRDRDQVAVLLLDLDAFKDINDSLGHGPGDLVLIEAGRRFSTCVRPGDTVARLGGDEFAVLLAGVEGPAAADEVAARILAQMELPFLAGGRTLHVQTSIGIAVGGPTAGVEALVRNADVAMYAAKARGKSRSVLFEDGMNEAAEERLLLVEELRGAVERGELVLNYQPIVDLEVGAMDGVEALVRWEHPTHGQLPPLEFIPLAEEAGLILGIGLFVLQEACRQLVVWTRQWGAIAPGYVTVNISTRQLVDEDLVAVVRRVLAETGCDPHRLVLEITESALLEDADAVLATLSELRRMGIRLGIDDFGTGYSSLSYLRSFPIDILKIDKSFLLDCRDDRMASALLEGIVALGTTLQLKTIAEGIELPEQAEYLRGAGCSSGQGYLYARPLPPDDLSQLLLLFPSSAVLPPAQPAALPPAPRIGEEGEGALSSR